MIDKYELIEILETLQDTGDIQFKESNKVDMVDRYLESCEGKNGVLPLVVGSACLHPMQNRVRTHRGYHCGDCGKRF